jgi:hypothetical protein
MVTPLPQRVKLAREDSPDQVESQASGVVVRANPRGL